MKNTAHNASCKAALINIGSPIETPDAAFQKNIESVRPFAAVGWEAIDLPAYHLFPFKTEDKAKAKLLDKVLLTKDIEAVFFAKGGYGIADVLPVLPWEKLKTAAADNSAFKWLIGFSDVCSLQWACYAQLGWQSLHASMPVQKCFDVQEIVQCMQSLRDGSIAGKTVFADLVWPGDQSLTVLSSKQTGEATRLLGGCFSVLTCMLGTPFMPDLGSKAGTHDYVLFFEDYAEPFAKINRQLTQWIQSGQLQNVKAIILGDFYYGPDWEKSHYQEIIAAMFAERTGLPIATSQSFGHGTWNQPIVNGSAITWDDKAANFCYLGKN